MTYIEVLYSKLGLWQFKRQLEALSRQKSCHPKMMALRAAVLEHFALSDAEDAPRNEVPEEEKTMVLGRIIIFTSYRESVTEILAMLQNHEPFIKAR